MSIKKLSRERQESLLICWGKNLSNNEIIKIFGFKNYQEMMATYKNVLLLQRKYNGDKA